MIRRVIVLVTAALLATSGLGTPQAEAKDQGILRIIKQMTLEEKVGQLFVLQVYGKSAATSDATDVAANRKLYGLDNAQQLVAKYRPGGIILYSVDPPNVTDARQVAHLTNGIQQAAMRTRVPIPDLIATDQEQGSVVSRIPAPFTQ